MSTTLGRSLHTLEQRIARWMREGYDDDPPAVGPGVPTRGPAGAAVSVAGPRSTQLGRCEVPTNIEIAQATLNSFMESHGHEPLQASGSQQDRILVGILAALIEIAHNLGTMARGEEEVV